jgi:hypothetical protein
MGKNKGDPARSKARASSSRYVSLTEYPDENSYLYAQGFYLIEFAITES